MIDRKSQSASALRRRRQAIKKARAELKRELREIEAEMACRKEPQWVMPTVTITREEAEKIWPKSTG